MTRSWLALLLLITLAGCAEPTFARLHFLDAKETPERPATYLGLPLRTGQVILSEAPGAYSLLFSLAPERHFDFTHAAILVMEDGEPYVYEMTGEYKLGLGDTPTEGIEGSCKRMPLTEYALAYLYVEVFDPPPGVDGEKVGAWVQERYREGAAFDAYFDYDEHEKLFCSEFVQLALEAGGAPPVELVDVRKQPSLQRLLGWLGVARERCLPAGLFAHPQRSAAALGQSPTLTAAACYFAAKAELHRRFSDDQRLGNLFQMTGMADITIRPAVYEFLRQATRLWMGQRKPPPPEAIETAVRSLAEQLLGVAESTERAGARGPGAASEGGAR